MLNNPSMQDVIVLNASPLIVLFNSGNRGREILRFSGWDETEVLKRLIRGLSVGIE